MTSPSYKPLVLIVGATGRTGGVIIDALIKCAKFRTVALIRPSSAAKPEVEQLRARGVEIRLGDITDTEDKHKAVLSGIDVLISAVHSEHLTAQKPLISAARDVGVKRVIPCDFAMPGAKGVQDMLDEKLAIRDFVRALGVGYTFVDVGWWMQLALPFPTSSEATGSPWVHISREFYAKGDKKNLYTNMEHIGTYVARIIDDDRTLNQYVIIWEDELTLEEVKTIAEKASGEEDVLRAKRVVVEADELQSRAKVAKEEALRNPNPGTQILRHGNQFMISMHILGENSLENAKALGALDVRELYPDIVPQKLGDFAQTFYQAPSLPNVQ
ncbi:hypothetical protein POSPLADRAFT_1152493 [Postia placenta MAD-698-R-SB12]|uniref:NmrA-like domain-containing protein n=1 Tax=Postia placenta MAD-698-R-SB12 TaxID=670580 RepID=A0A1X6MPX8_9APHY|nr:hypothetical protein POSPLADRAFT_1152493 [Postia placenta MAD-698-R-SB12]OSX58467.1 hypothetical protein POSPLADRAFT_1152493 [Postia placenta MAD-698-R-SB12]